MNSRSIRPLYDSMNPEELYRAALAAAARGDVAERDAITGRCPRVTTSVRHPDFEAAFEGTRALVDAAASNLARYLGWIEILDITGPLVEEALDVLLGSPGPPGDGGWPLRVGTVARSIALTRLAGMLEALEEVAAEQGLDAREVMAAFCPGIARDIDLLSQDIADAPASPEVKDDFVTFLRETWTAAT